MAEADWADVSAIYREGLETGIAAFMTDPPDWNDWNSGHFKEGRFVARRSGGTIAGWCAMAPVPDT